MQTIKESPSATEPIEYETFDQKFYENNEDNGKDILGTGSCFLRQICSWYDCKAKKCILYKKGETSPEANISSRILELLPILSEKKKRKLQKHPYFSQFLPKH